MNRHQRRAAARRLGGKGGGVDHDGDRLLQAAVTLHGRGQLKEAEIGYRHVLDVEPEQPDALHFLGILMHQQGDVAKAVALLDRSLSARPNSSIFHNNFGKVLYEVANFERAADHYQRAIDLDNDHAEAYNNLGLLRARQGDPAGAETLLSRAVELSPDYAEAHNNLGLAHIQRGDFEAGLDACRRALALKPDLVDAHNNMGNGLRMLGRLSEAEECCRAALELQPGMATLASNLGSIQMSQGKLAEAIRHLRRALDLQPDFSDAHSNLLLAMNYAPDSRPEELSAEARCWEAVHAAPLTDLVLPHGNNPEPERRLRIGYVSPDFKSHSVASFFEPVAAAHDGEAVEVFCYADIDSGDDTTDRLEALADVWRPVFGSSDEALAGMIREDGIDVLVDLTGHTAGNRLRTFAMRPAPVQVTWLGYPGTTGLSAMDYRLTDTVADPDGASGSQHTEELIRLPRRFLCYAPAEKAPQSEQPPCAKSGHVTFGSFNVLAKMSAPVIEAWSAILDRVPDSRLLLKNRSLGDVAAQQRYRAMFADRGIDPNRIFLHGWMPERRAHFTAYGDIDVALDTFPYNGTTTTCEALYMGVPVVTLSGDRHAGRVGAALLTAVGMDSLVAETQEAYVEAAVRLAGDQGHLLALRGSLRDTLLLSPLCDADSFTRDLEDAYRAMWHRWCDSAQAADDGRAAGTGA